MFCVLLRKELFSLGHFKDVSFYCVIGRDRHKKMLISDLRS